MRVRPRNDGFTLIELMIVISILVIAFMTFYPEWQHENGSGNQACEKALRLHGLIASDIQRLSIIFGMSDSDERIKRLEAFKNSESGKRFFDEFCPALRNCRDHLEIQENYEIPLRTLCELETTRK